MRTVVYKISNTVNNDCYIGSSNNFKRRSKRHWEDLRRGVHHSIKLQRAVNKYGIENFLIAEVESFQFISKEETLKREQYHLDLVRPKYNICLVAGSQLGAKRNTSFRLKCSERMSGKPPWNKGLKLPKQSDYTKAKRASSMMGKQHSSETKAKISMAHKGKILTEDHRQKLSKAKIKHGRYLRK